MAEKKEFNLGESMQELRETIRAIHYANREAAFEASAQAKDGAILLPACQKFGEELTSLAGGDKTFADNFNNAITTQMNRIASGDVFNEREFNSIFTTVGQKIAELKSKDPTKSDAADKLVEALKELQTTKVQNEVAHLEKTADIQKKKARQDAALKEDMNRQYYGHMWQRLAYEDDKEAYNGIGKLNDKHYFLENGGVYSRAGSDVVFRCEIKKEGDVQSVSLISEKARDSSQGGRYWSEYLKDQGEKIALMKLEAGIKKLVIDFDSKNVYLPELRALIDLATKQNLYVALGPNALKAVDALPKEAPKGKWGAFLKRIGYHVENQREVYELIKKANGNAAQYEHDQKEKVAAVKLPGEEGYGAIKNSEPSATPQVAHIYQSSQALHDLKDLQKIKEVMSDQLKDIVSLAKVDVDVLKNAADNIGKKIKELDSWTKEKVTSYSDMRSLKEWFAEASQKIDARASELAGLAPATPPTNSDLSTNPGVSIAAVDSQVPPLDKPVLSTDPKKIQVIAGEVDKILHPAQLEQKSVDVIHNLNLVQDKVEKLPITSFNKDECTELTATVVQPMMQKVQEVQGTTSTSTEAQAAAAAADKLGDRINDVITQVKEREDQLSKDVTNDASSSGSELPQQASSAPEEEQSSSLSRPG